MVNNPYVEPEVADRIVGNAEFRAAGELAQRKAIVVLKNVLTPDGNILPIQGRPRLYVENIAINVASDYGQVVPDINDSDIAILRLKAPYQLRDGNFLERMLHTGDLDFKGEEKDHILSILNKVPMVVDIYLDRPAVIPEVVEQSAALHLQSGEIDSVRISRPAWGEGDRPC